MTGRLVKYNVRKQMVVGNIPKRLINRMDILGDTFLPLYGVGLISGMADEKRTYV